MGPLKGLKIIEMAGIGPGPFCGMVLADLGADIIRIDRSAQHGHGNTIDFQHRSKFSLTADLKNPDTAQEIKKLLSKIISQNGINLHISSLISIFCE